MKKRMSPRPALILDCAYCGEKVRKLQSQLQKRPFCNSKCAGKFYADMRSCQAKENNKHSCTFCGNVIFRKPSDLYTRSSYGSIKSKNPFCSKECSGKWCVENKIGIYNPEHLNSIETLRSKLELHFDHCFLEYFPYIKVFSNDRLVCAPYELDFYIPDLKLAIEINGIHHYKPIYGEEHLCKIQSHDLYKKNVCEQQGIQLVIVENLYARFSEKVGNDCWNQQIKPILLSMIPYCENKQ